MRTKSPLPTLFVWNNLKRAPLFTNLLKQLVLDLRRTYVGLTLFSILFVVSTMVIMPNTIQTGWDFGPDDSIIDNLSTGTTSSFKRNENLMENDGEHKLREISTRKTHNYSTSTDEEGWTTTSLGKKKPKKNNNQLASIESIITTIDSTFEHIEVGKNTRIYVTSPGRKNKCNIPDNTNKTIEFNPIGMTKTKGTGEEKGQNKDDKKNSGNTTNKGSEQNNNNNSNENKNNEDKGDENKGEGQDDKNNNDKNNNDKRSNRDSERGGRGGRGTRGGRGGKERKQTPRKEWETYEFSISFNPKTMTNKDPDAEFQAVLSQIMKKSPGVTFHSTNEDMFPKPKPFTTLQGYPQTEAAFKDFFEVYENKGLTTYRIFIKATMQYNELDLRNSLLNYLRSNNLWMSSDLISESIDEMIGYINYGHDKLVWRPECEKKINNGIQALIQSGSISEALRFKIEGLKKEIYVRVAAGTFRGGTRNDPVMCEGLVLRTTKAQARATIELLGLMDESVLGTFYGIIPRGIDRELGPKLYGDLLRTNNDMLNTLRSIAVVNWPEELFLDHYNPAPDIPGTLAKRIDNLLMNVWNCVAIEKTMDTETRGKYLLIFQEKDMEKAKESIGNLIEAFGRKSDRPCAKIALERFHEFPEFDSIQRVSQSVHSRGLRIREMLETAASQRTTSTTKKPKQQKFQFHVNKELQQQLPISTHKSYSSITKQQVEQKKQLTIVQPTPQKLQPIIRQQQTSTPTQETTQPTQMNVTPQESRTVATNNSGLSVDQQTITTMMTQITNQFKDMERERIIREERQETKRQEREAKAEEKREEREARMEEKRMDAQKEMYTFMQTMMTININKTNNQDHDRRKEPIPEELTTDTAEQTSALTTSIITTTSSTTQSAKRSSSQLSNNDEETEMYNNETGIETQENNEDEISIKRNKTLIGKGESDDEIMDDEEMLIENERQNNTTSTHESTIIDEVMTTTESDTSSFTKGFNNQQFKTKTSSAPWPGVSQQ